MNNAAKKRVTQTILLSILMIVLYLTYLFFPEIQKMIGGR